MTTRERDLLVSGLQELFKKSEELGYSSQDAEVFIKFSHLLEDDTVEELNFND